MDRSIASLDGRTAIVTGSGQGIGKGLAMGMAAFGANIVVVDRNAETANATAKELEGYGVKTMASVTNVRKPDEVKAMVKAAMARFGRIDILINNVGGGFTAEFMDLSEKGWDTLIDANLKSVFLCTRAAAEEMIKGKRGGSIIQVTSIEAFRAAPGWSVYSACKAGMENFTKTLSLELSHHKIRVNSIAPGHIITPGVPNSGDSEEFFWKTIPLGRAGTIEDMAGTAVFLASDMSAYLTGITIHVDGGMKASGGHWNRTPDNHWTAR